MKIREAAEGSHDDRRRGPLAIVAAAGAAIVLMLNLFGIRALERRPAASRHGRRDRHEVRPTAAVEAVMTWASSSRSRWRSRSR